MGKSANLGSEKPVIVKVILPPPSRLLHHSSLDIPVGGRPLRPSTSEERSQDRQAIPGVLKL